LKQVYRDLEFHSLLKELGPSEDSRAHDYQELASVEAVREWLGAIPEGAPVAVAISKSGEGELALGGDADVGMIGMAWKPREARAASLALRDALQPFLEDATRSKISCDVKSVLLALDHLGIAGAGFAHDIMLYAFLLDAEPSGCPLDEQARRRLDLQLGGAPEQRADITLEIYELLHPAVGQRGLDKLYAEIELPLARVLARMERAGVGIDRAELARLSDLMEREIAGLTSE